MPTLDEGDILIAAKHVPSTSLTDEHRVQQGDGAGHPRQRPDGKPLVPEVDFVCSKEGTGDAASDPIPMNAADTFIILKPRSAVARPGQAQGTICRRRSPPRWRWCPGTSLEFTQPIEDRFNELVAGVRTDGGGAGLRGRFRNDRPRRHAGEEDPGDGARAPSVEVSSTTGVPVMTFDLDGEAAGRQGLTRADVADVVTIAVGGREAGVIYEGDRRFNLVVRLADQIREDLDALRALPVPLPKPDTGRQCRHVREKRQRQRRLQDPGPLHLRRRGDARGLARGGAAAGDVHRDRHRRRADRDPAAERPAVRAGHLQRQRTRLGSFVAEARRLVEVAGEATRRARDITLNGAGSSKTSAPPSNGCRSSSPSACS